MSESHGLTERQRRTGIIRRIFTQLPRQQGDQDDLGLAIDGYVDATSDIPVVWLAAACRRLVLLSSSDKPFAPVPGEIRREVARNYARFRRMERGKDPNRDEVGRPIDPNAETAEVLISELGAREAAHTLGRPQVRADGIIETEEPVAHHALDIPPASLPATFPVPPPPQGHAPARCAFAASFLPREAQCPRFAEIVVRRLAGGVFPACRFHGRYVNTDYPTGDRPLSGLPVVVLPLEAGATWELDDQGQPVVWLQATEAQRTGPKRGAGEPVSLGEALKGATGAPPEPKVPR